MSRVIQAKTAKRISALMDERGISHLVHHSECGGATSIEFWITDDSGGVETGVLTSESLIADQDWLDLPVI